MGTQALQHHPKSAGERLVRLDFRLIAVTKSKQVKVRVEPQSFVPHDGCPWIADCTDARRCVGDCSKEAA